MGGCCSTAEQPEGLETRKGRPVDNDDGGDDDEDKDDGETLEGDGGAVVRLKGSCEVASMFTQQGNKGINQDAMTIWEHFNGDKDNIFCGVFDGHGPLGHKVATYVRDFLPSKLSQELRSNDSDDNEEEEEDDDFSSCDSHDNADGPYPSFASIEAGFFKAFQEVDHELHSQSTFDFYCSGATAVSILKQGEHLFIANLGDSRAILCTRDDNNQPIPVQLTVDLKPNLPSEFERIISCNGRVFALEEESEVHRIWLPDENCPGLAMARAFGDFCLKDYGLISIPQVFYRKLTDKDEFVVLATDGIWDVLSNKEVLKIVASAKKPSMAAKLLVDRAVRKWRYKYPTSKVDDCAAICLFLKSPSLPTRSTSTVPENDLHSQQPSFSDTSTVISDREAQSVGIAEANDLNDRWNSIDRVNSFVALSRFPTVRS